MKSKKQTTKKPRTTKKLSTTRAGILAQTHLDMFIAVLIVSLLVNLFVFIGWLILRMTSAYDQEVISFLFSR